VVALADVPDTARVRIQRFSEDLAAGQALIREQWMPLGTIVAVYVGVIAMLNKGIVKLADQIGVPTPRKAPPVETASSAAQLAAAPSAGIAMGVTAVGTALVAPVLWAAATLLPATAGYPDEIRLVPAVQFEESPYPMGIPSDIELELERSGRLAADELDDPGKLESGDRATATLTFTDGDLEGRTFTFEDVVVPVEWRIEDPSSSDVVNWADLAVSASDDDGFVPPGMPVADIRHVNGETYAGYRVASTGELRLSFPYRGDELARIFRPPVGDRRNATRWAAGG
jgi:hypothetical protein